MLCARYAEAGARLGVRISAGPKDVALRGLAALRNLLEKGLPT